ncbi:hypothetical protein HM1_2193 [Heliomicrobium modesticaldum Ice1]|uniref:Flagellar hook-length control protein-like C-terminal domain-containing protein n=1 Tax=Heliobacterium modesticaldum (strain ATCC 51547 / Ice1) TaxID=498761 RepID=B0TH74_HELMI|nr:flagellar hook-length control protein FliK [Heliomicrobium modesticaldum]ABZ84749.1 hypothetical protein HM1_2193 [Heliomicrobium modesticaldum Ice1]
MDISQILGRALLFGRGQRNRPEGVNWKVGAIVDGLVLEMLLKDTYAVNVEGKKLTLQSPYPLSPGEAIRLEVQGHSEGQVRARLLPLESRDAAGDRAATLLRQAGMDDTPQNRMILRSLTASMLGLTRENFQQVARAMALLGNTGEQSSQTAAFALKSAIPMGGEMLRLLQSAFTGEPLQGLQDWLNEAKAVIKAQGGDVPEGLLKLEAELVKTLPESKDPAEVLARKLARLLESQMLVSRGERGGLSQSRSTPVNRLDVAVAPGAMNRGGDPFVEAGASSDAGATGRSGRAAVEPSVRDNIATDRPAAERVSGEKAAQGMAEGTARDRTIALAQQIARAVREVESFFTSRGVDAADLISRGVAIEERLAGHQVLQGLDKGIQGDNDYLSFTIPYRLAGGKEGYGQLRVYKDGKNRTLDPENVRLALVLDTEHLGFISIELAVRRKEVQSRVTVVDPAVMKAGQVAWPELQQALAEQGFHLGGANWRVGPPADLRPAPAEAPMSSELGRLNIRI